MTDYFDIVDDAIDSLKAQVAILYYDLRKNVAKFDSINVIGNMNTLKQRILQLSIDAFYAMAAKLHAELSENTLSEAPTRSWVRERMYDYCRTTKYVIAHEIERKCDRAAEAVICSNKPKDELDNALRLMLLTLLAAGEYITYEVVLKTFKDDGAEKVRWVAEKDLRTCDTCLDRDGEIYPIDSVPPPPHVNCRCILERVY
jgi:SPP1 gp7 family putative phage head morphogenesis protein